MALTKIRVGGVFSRGRIRTASAAIRFGAWLDRSLLELGLRIEPRFQNGGDYEAKAASRVWPGLLVLVIFAAGLAFTGIAAGWAISEMLPHREARP